MRNNCVHRLSRIWPMHSARRPNREPMPPTVWAQFTPSSCRMRGTFGRVLRRLLPIAYSKIITTNAYSSCAPIIACPSMASFRFLPMPSKRLSAPSPSIELQSNHCAMPGSCASTMPHIAVNTPSKYNSPLYKSSLATICPKSSHSSSAISTNNSPKTSPNIIAQTSPTTRSSSFRAISYTTAKHTAMSHLATPSKRKSKPTTPKRSRRFRSSMPLLSTNLPMLTHMPPAASMHYGSPHTSTMAKHKPSHSSPTIHRAADRATTICRYPMSLWR